jgi:hypothetical protein
MRTFIENVVLFKEKLLFFALRLRVAQRVPLSGDRGDRMLMRQSSETIKSSPIKQGSLSQRSGNEDTVS